MAVKSVVETLEGIPEALHGEYVKKTVGGKELFVLDVTDIEAHPTVRGLKTAHEAVKAKRDELKTQLDLVNDRFEGLPEDFTAQAYKDLQAAAEGKGGKVTQEQIDAIKADVTKKLEKEYGPVKARNGILEGEVRRRTIDEGLTTALLEAGITKEFLPAVRAMLKEKGKIDLVEENGRFSATVDTSMGPQSITEFVTDWATTTEGKAFVKPATGGDAGGGNGGKGDVNPFAVKEGERRNLTAIQELVKANPVKAREQARAAGIKDNQLAQFGLSQ